MDANSDSLAAGATEGADRQRLWAWSPDGRWFATVDGGTLGWWDWDAGASPPRLSAELLLDRCERLFFDSHGDFFMALDERGVARVCPTRRADWVATARRAAGRNFTAREWDAAWARLGEPYRETFPGWGSGGVADRPPPRAAVVTDAGTDRSMVADSNGRRTVRYHIESLPIVGGPRAANVNANAAANVNANAGAGANAGANVGPNADAGEPTDSTAADAGKVGADADRAAAIVREAWRVWEAVGPLRAVEVSASQRPHVVIRAERLDGPSGAPAHGQLGPPREGVMLELRLDAEQTWTEDLLRLVAAHELGHLLGLGHTATPGQLMSDSVPDTVRTPQPEDIQRLRALWSSATGR